MTEKITNLAKNTSYFTLALILQKIISFSYFIIIARALGPEDLGKYYFAISFATVFSIFMDFGLTNVLTREIAKEKAQANNYFSAILTIKIPLSIITGLIIIIIANLLDYSELTKTLIYFSTACVILDSFTAAFFSVSRGFHNLSFESAASVLFQVIVLITGLIILKLGLGLNWLIGALLLASIFNFIYSLYVISGIFKLSLRPIYDPKLIKLILKISISFGLFAVFQKVYTYFDTVLLSTLAGDYYVGLYQVAFKIMNALQFLPLAFTASLYPAMSAYWASNREQLAVTFERAMNYLIIISLPISVGIAVLADKIVLIFKSGFEDAVLPLEINIVALLFMFIAYPIGSLLNACDKQKVNTVNMAVTVAASIILNLILIPRFQAVGASITVLVSSILMLILGLIQVPKIIAYRPKKILLVFSKALLASALMMILIVYLKNYLNIFIIVPLAAVIYFILLYYLKAFRKEDLASLYRSLMKKSVNESIAADSEALN
ncbi:MAG: flippase [bacterium]|nr:flippase [bacterium]